jgi:carboxypeptidase C (cathepsin A)
MRALAALLCVPALLAQGPKSSDRPADKPADKAPEKPEEKPVVTKHQITVGGRTLAYTVTTGLMPLKNAAGEKEADIFYMAYTLDGADATKRPLMFSFNGGPGSASVWLHLGALGPKRVKMGPDGLMPPPPYKVEDNPATWLDQTDLVFIDPVGTGYSRAAKPELNAKFHGLKGDIESVGEFIRLYLGRANRWTSPLFLVGESYGTTRAAGLAGHLVEKGIALNGVVLVSSILNFQTARFTVGNDLPYPLYLPTYTATAFYHKRLAPELQKDLQATLRESEAFAGGAYTAALAKGDRLTDVEKDALATQLARLTGLDKTYVLRANLRIHDQNFYKELLRDKDRVVGRLDSRFTGVDPEGNADTPENDPSLSAIRPPYTAAFNDYVRRELGYTSDQEYYILGGGVGRWDFGSDNRYADTSDALRQAFAKNPFMKLFVANGYYDVATPYFATQYTLSHMRLDAGARARVSQGFYEAGHMMYIEEKSLQQLKKDVSGFLEGALKR